MSAVSRTLVVPRASASVKPAAPSAPRAAPAALGVAAAAVLLCCSPAQADTSLLCRSQPTACTFTAAGKVAVPKSEYKLPTSEAKGVDSDLSPVFFGVSLVVGAFESNRLIAERQEKGLDTWLNRPRSAAIKRGGR